MKTEIIQLTDDPNVTLTTYVLKATDELPNAMVRPAVLIFPGGGYRFCSEREAEPIAMGFLAAGFHAFVLRYSLNEQAKFPRPLNDAEAALTLIRDHAEAWGIDPQKIAVCGFSAGGHLTAALGTMGSVRPNALVLGYPCIQDTLSDVLPHPIPSLEKEVDDLTPPTFLFHTAADQLVSVQHSLAFADALDRHNIPFEMHIFQNGTHGLALSNDVTSAGICDMVEPDAEKWFGLCVAWLKNLFGRFPAEKQLPKTRMDNHPTAYSVDVAIKVLWENPTCWDVVLQYLPMLANEDTRRQANFVSIRMANEYGNKFLTDEQIAEIDATLRAIPFTAE
ncbi:MAG: alpha/beta hydrolase [Anaerolineaceae bacterium]|nr:alpha/beta hydrolase [Anaerolineaceae bacterium]